MQVLLPRSKGVCFHGGFGTIVLDVIFDKLFRICHCFLVKFLKFCRVMQSFFDWLFQGFWVIVSSGFLGHCRQCAKLGEVSVFLAVFCVIQELSCD